MNIFCLWYTPKKKSIQDAPGSSVSQETAITLYYMKERYNKKHKG